MAYHRVRLSYLADWIVQIRFNRIERHGGSSSAWLARASHRCREEKKRRAWWFMKKIYYLFWRIRIAPSSSWSFTRSSRSVLSCLSIDLRRWNISSARWRLFVLFCELSICCWFESFDVLFIATTGRFLAGSDATLMSSSVSSDSFSTHCKEVIHGRRCCVRRWRHTTGRFRTERGAGSDATLLNSSGVIWFILLPIVKKSSIEDVVLFDEDVITTGRFRTTREGGGSDATLLSSSGVIWFILLPIVKKSSMDEDVDSSSFVDIFISRIVITFLRFFFGERIQRFLSLHKKYNIVECVCMWYGYNHTP